MSDKHKILCPSCGMEGSPVSRRTVGSLVRPQLRPRIPSGDKFWFCKTPDCNTVYFAEEKCLFNKSDISIRAGIKERDDTALLCYCFGYTKKMILDEITSTGKSTIPDKIKEQVKRGNCYCEITNPQGSCCLGNITEFMAAQKCRP